MADDDTADPPADPPADADLPRRVDSLEGKIDAILAKLGGEGGAGTETEPEGAPNIAHEIRQQLDERDRRNAEQADKDGIRAELDEVKVRLSELAERPPGPLPRRIEKIMGWT